jgi:hypothetical protein
MFEVTEYEYPAIYVRCRRTSETYLFSVSDDGTLSPRESSFDQGEARRIAMAYLHRLHRTAADVAA